jgi:hypothetical protein
MKAAAIAGIYEVMKEEVEQFCGRAFSRKGDQHLHRGGSAPGSVWLHGQRVAVERPRVRCGKKEKELVSYRTFRDQEMLSEEVERLLVRGVSTRDYGQAQVPIEGATPRPSSGVAGAFG